MDDDNYLFRRTKQTTCLSMYFASNYKCDISSIPIEFQVATFINCYCYPPNKCYDLASYKSKNHSLSYLLYAFLLIFVFFFFFNFESPAEILDLREQNI